jgi:ActR/RegA family two-component response regulator
MPASRILFVDDETNIRLTLPQILKSHGYDVTVTATVAEALAEINSRPFDLLIADLNIGQVGDGFTVVSAMRRTQPNCVNFILTGYPAFETALQAIRSQVDDYLVKPADIESLISAIESKLQNRQPYQPATLKRVGAILQENAEQIVRKALQRMASHAELQGLRLTDQERVDHMPAFLREITDQLESSPDERSATLPGTVAEHGRARYRQGYSIPLMIEDVRLFHDAIYEVIQDNLLALDLSRLISDLRRMDNSVEVELKEAIQAYIAEEKSAAPAKKKREASRVSKAAAKKRAAS